jgi:hypothetical protein
MAQTKVNHRGLQARAASGDASPGDEPNKVGCERGQARQGVRFTTSRFKALDRAGQVDRRRSSPAHFYKNNRPPEKTFEHHFNKPNPKVS